MEIEPILPPKRLNLSFLFHRLEIEEDFYIYTVCRKMKLMPRAMRYAEECKGLKSKEMG